MSGKSVILQLHPETLHWIRKEVQADMGDDSVIQLLEEWELGAKKPTLSQVQKLSNETHIPFGYFFLKEKPAEKYNVLEFRTLDSVYHGDGSQALRDTIFEMLNVQDWMKQYRMHQGNGVLSYVGSLKNEIDAPIISASIRKKLDISTAWFQQCKDADHAFKLIREKCEAIGILVMLNSVVGANTHRPLSLKEFRAFALCDSYAPLIFINARDMAVGRLFSLLHEIVHIFVGADNLFNATDEDEHFSKSTETLCNKVAAEILLPSDYFLAFWDRCKREQADTMVCIKETGRVFHCSLTAVARRALDLQRISSTEYANYTKMFSQGYARNKEKGHGGNYYHTIQSRIDKHFLKALADSVLMGRTSYTEAFRLTNTNNKTFTHLVSTLEGGK